MSVQAVVQENRDDIPVFFIFYRSDMPVNGEWRMFFQKPDSFLVCTEQRRVLDMLFCEKATCPKGISSVGEG